MRAAWSQAKLRQINNSVVKTLGAPVAQWIERPPPERKVACSNHAGRVVDVAWPGGFGAPVDCRSRRAICERRSSAKFCHSEFAKWLHRAHRAKGIRVGLAMPGRRLSVRIGHRERKGTTPAAQRCEQ
jgi:hypothetical protein